MKTSRIPQSKTIRTTVSSNHWSLVYYTERMTTREWKQILLAGGDSIIYRGCVVKLVAKRLGYGVVEISKDLSDLPPPIMEVSTPVETKKDTQCTYVPYTRCSKEATVDGKCDDHKDLKCSVCGKPATHGCSYTGQFVCGQPLCDECEGWEDTSKEPGSWGFLNHSHRAKSKSAA
jgi:hypothetical protein